MVWEQIEKYILLSSRFGEFWDHFGCWMIGQLEGLFFSFCACPFKGLKLEATPSYYCCCIVFSFNVLVREGFALFFCAIH